jgi:hypothetical protein
MVTLNCHGRESGKIKIGGQQSRLAWEKRDITSKINREKKHLEHDLIIGRAPSSKP